MSSDSYFIRNQHAVHFLTFTVVGWIDVFTRPSYKIEITESLEYCRVFKGLNLYAFCLMSNHIHLIVQSRAPFLITDFIRDFKKFTAKSITRKIMEEPESRRSWMIDQFLKAGRFDKRITTLKFWQEGYHAIELETNEMIEQKINYIHQNPVRALLVEHPEDYLYSSSRNYASLDGTVGIDEII